MNDSPLSVNNISGNWCAVSCVFLLFCHWAKFGGCSLVNAAVFDSRKEPRGRVGCEWKDFRVRLLERHTLEAEERVRERSQLPNSIRSVSDRWRASVCGDLFQFSVTFHCESLNKLLLCEQPQPSSSLSLFLLSLYCPLFTEISTSANISLVTAGTWFLSPLTLRGSSRSLFVSRKGLRNTHDALLQWGPDSPSHERTHSCCISDLLGTTTQYSRLSTLVEERVRRSLFYCQDSFFLLLYPLLFLSNPSLSPSHIFCSKWRGNAGNGETRDRNNTPLNNLRNWRIKIMTDAVLKAL